MRRSAPRWLPDWRWASFRPGGSAPRALLGPMALRRQTHVGVPPPAFALRGGSLLYRSGRGFRLMCCRGAGANLGTNKMGSGAVVRSTPRRDGPSGSRAEPWTSCALAISQIFIPPLHPGGRIRIAVLCPGPLISRTPNATGAYLDRRQCARHGCGQRWITNRNTTGAPLTDVIVLVLGTGFILLMAAYAALCDRI